MCRRRRSAGRSFGQCSTLSQPEAFCTIRKIRLQTSQIGFMKAHTAKRNVLQDKNLGDRLRSCLQVGFSLAAPSCRIQKSLHLSVVPRVELRGPEFQLVESLCSPDVVHGGDKRNVDASLLVELRHHLREAVASPAFSGGLFVQEEKRMKEERIPHPKESKERPSWIVFQ